MARWVSSGRLLFLVIALPLCGEWTAEEVASRARAHLILGDFRSAESEVEQALEIDSSSQILLETWIAVKAARGDSVGIIKAWKGYLDYFPEQVHNKRIIEEVAWGVLQAECSSSALDVQVYALIGAFLSQDVRGVDLLHKAMHNGNAAVRGVAVELAAYFRDRRLQKDVLALLESDPSWQVRREALSTVGRMHVTSARPHLEKIIADATSQAEEKAAAMASLVALLDTVHRSELEHLVGSSRSGLRSLACRLIAHFQLEEAIDLVVPLLEDAHAEVRQHAVAAIGLLRASNYEEYFRTALEDPDSATAITAAWALTLHRPEEGVRALRGWLEHRDRDVRLMAAGALAATGQYGVGLMQESMQEQRQKDPLCRLNTALGAAGQRLDTPRVCEILAAVVADEEQKVMWKEQWPFRWVASSQIAHRPHIPQYPETLDQLLRLELINTLAYLEYPDSDLQRTLEGYLQKCAWGVTGTAAATLLEEGDEHAIQVIEQLLEDSKGRTQVQVALVLALWGRDPRAIEVLEKAYSSVDRQLKERILEGLGAIGSKDSIPFLLDTLKEPFPSLRAIAAASIVQCLYH